METVIIVLQFVCVAVLAVGAMVSLCELVQRSSSDYAVANDSETDGARSRD